MPDIEVATRLRQPHLGPAVAPIDATGARATRGLPSRLRAALSRALEAIRTRAAEIIHHEIPVCEPSSVPYIQCDHCGDIHTQTTRCAARAIGFCANCNRRRMLEGARCSKCGSSQVTDVHFRWAIEGGRR